MSRQEVSKTFRDTGNTRPKRVSSSDVAKLAGVSRTTVSFVLNDVTGQSIPESTRQRVLDAARELGYTPSAEARALRSGRSAVVLCLLPDWPVAGNIGVLLEELSEKLAEHGYTMLSHQRTEHDRALGTVLSSITPAAILGMCSMTSAEVTEVDRLGIRLVRWVGEIPGKEDQSGLTQDRIGYAQASALIEDGHTTIGYVLPESDKLAWFSRPRLAGIEQACAEASLVPPVTMQTDRDLPAVAGKLSSWVRRHGVTGLCAYNDEVAFSILTAMRQVGLRAPDDLAVIGVDDSMLSIISDPTISTIAFDLSREARSMAAKLVLAAEGKEIGPPPAPGGMSVIRRASTNGPTR